MIQLDDASAIPPYEQIRAQITEMIHARTLRPGARLPAVRQLAGDLEVAPGTVTRAYRELQHDGLVTSRGPTGTFVAEKAPRLSRDDQRRRLDDATQQFVAVTRRLGIAPHTAIKQIQRALE